MRHQVVRWLAETMDSAKLGGEGCHESQNKQEVESSGDCSVLDRARWYNMFMRELRILESTAFDRIAEVERDARKRVEDVGIQVRDEAVQRVRQEMKTQCCKHAEVVVELSSAVAGLQSELAVVQEMFSGSEEARSASLQVLRSEVELQASQQEAGMNTLRQMVEQASQQVSCAEVAIHDLRSFASAEHQRQQTHEGCMKQVVDECSNVTKFLASQRSVEEVAKGLLPKIDVLEQRMVAFECRLEAFSNSGTMHGCANMSQPGACEMRAPAHSEGDSYLHGSVQSNYGVAATEEEPHGATRGRHLSDGSESRSDDQAAQCTVGLVAAGTSCMALSPEKPSPAHDVALAQAANNRVVTRGFEEVNASCSAKAVGGSKNIPRGTCAPGDMQTLAAELSTRMGRLEEAVVQGLVQLAPRVSTLESEVTSTSSMFTTFLKDRASRVSALAAEVRSTIGSEGAELDNLAGKHIDAIAASRSQSPQPMLTNSLKSSQSVSVPRLDLGSITVVAGTVDDMPFSPNLSPTTPASSQDTVITELQDDGLFFPNIANASEPSRSQNRETRSSPGSLVGSPECRANSAAKDAQDAYSTTSCRVGEIVACSGDARVPLTHRLQAWLTQPQSGEPLGRYELRPTQFEGAGSLTASPIACGQRRPLQEPASYSTGIASPMPPASNTAATWTQTANLRFGNWPTTRLRRSASQPVRSSTSQSAVYVATAEHGHVVAGARFSSPPPRTVRKNAVCMYAVGDNTPPTQGQFLRAALPPPHTAPRQLQLASNRSSSSIDALPVLMGNVGTTTVGVKDRAAKLVSPRAAQQRWPSIDKAGCKVSRL